MKEPTRLTLPMLTMSITGNMMGSGVFLLPASLAKIGSVSIFGWILTAIGSAALALIFSRLTMLYPKAGGPYAFSRAIFGNFLGFQTAFLYWIGAWIGNIALAIAVIGYAAYFFPFLHTPLNECLVGVALVWFFTVVNMFGPRTLGRIQSFTTTTMLIPILGTAFLGWLWFDKSIFLSSYSITGQSSFDSITKAGALTLWAFVGVETACVNAGVVENPARNIPLATLFGTLLAATAYILSSAAIMGIVPAAELSGSSAPFSLVATKIFGATAGGFVSFCAVISCLGTLAGWSLVTGQISKAAADDHLFPKIFAVVNKKHVPYLGLICSAILVTILFFATLSPTISSHFEVITSAAVFVIVLPYLYSSAALFVASRKQNFSQKEKLFYDVAAIIGIIFSCWAIWGLGQTIVYYGSLCVIASVLFYMYPLLAKKHS